MYLPEIEPRMSTRTLVTKLDKIGSVHQDIICENDQDATVGFVPWPIYMFRAIFSLKGI